MIVNDYWYVSHKFDKFLTKMFCSFKNESFKKDKDVFSMISGSLRKIEFSYCSIATNSAVCLTIEGNLLKPGTFGRGFLESQSNFAALQFYEIFSDY